MQKNAWVCFRIPSSLFGNNPSLQIHLSMIDSDQGKCNKTGDPCIYDFCTIPTSHMLILAHSSYSLSDEAYRLSLSLLCFRLSTTSYACTLYTRHFFGNLFIKTCCCWDKMCLSCLMQSVGSLELMIYRTPSNICDFGLNIHFPHILWFLHHNRVGISWFTLTKLRNVVDKDKTILSSVDTRGSMIAQSVSLNQFCCRAHSALKKTRWAKVNSLKFLVLDTF